MKKVYLPWIDVETFGLNVNRDLVIEVGLVVTDDQLDLVDAKSWLIWTPRHLERLGQQRANAMGPGDDAFTKSERLVLDMHTKSGLYDDAIEAGREFLDISREIWDFTEPFEFDRRTPIWGSSVAFDRGVMGHYFPAWMAQFSYRNADVSSTKEQVRVFRPDLMEEFEASRKDFVPAHRTLDDIQASIEELKYYREHFFRTRS